MNELSDAAKRMDEDILVVEPQKWESVGKSRKPSPPVVGQAAAKQAALQPKVEHVVKVEHISSHSAAPSFTQQQTAVKAPVEEKAVKQSKQVRGI